MAMDPACGTAGFLVSSAEYIREHYEDEMTDEQWDHYGSTMFTGFDTDRTMLRISAMNLMLHSIANPEIDYKDSVSKQNQISGKYTICLANLHFDTGRKGTDRNGGSGGERQPGLRTSGHRVQMCRPDRKTSA